MTYIQAHAPAGPASQGLSGVHAPRLHHPCKRLTHAGRHYVAHRLDQLCGRRAVAPRSALEEPCDTLAIPALRVSMRRARRVDDLVRACASAGADTGTGVVP